MRLTGVSPESGWTGLSVRTALANPSTRPGLRLPGRVTVVAGSVDVPVLHVRLGLVTTPQPDPPEAQMNITTHKTRNTAY
ncbi:sporulation protein, partial [Micromonospora sp. NPDC004336]